MKVKIHILPLLLVFGSVFSQTDTLNQFYADGNKQGHWIYCVKDQLNKGYPPEDKIAEGTFISDRKNGIWIIYYVDGKILPLRYRWLTFEN